MIRPASFAAHIDARAIVVNLAGGSESGRQACCHWLAWKLLERADSNGVDEITLVFSDGGQTTGCVVELNSGFAGYEPRLLVEVENLLEWFVKGEP
jgi:hypothetical protein